MPRPSRTGGLAWAVRNPRAVPRSWPAP